MRHVPTAKPSVHTGNVIYVVPILFSLIGAGCHRSNPVSQAQERTQSKEKFFAPHPGKIVRHMKWDGKDEVVDAAGVPDQLKFIYYDRLGQQVAGQPLAAYRVPIVETDIVSMDKDGHPTNPKKAINYSITEYGPRHCELRHTTAIAPASK